MSKHKENVKAYRRELQHTVSLSDAKWWFDLPDPP